MGQYMAKLPMDRAQPGNPPASPLVEATLAAVQDVIRRRFGESGLDWADFSKAGNDAGISKAEMEKVEQRILASGYRFAWSAAISAQERPEIYQPSDSEGRVDESFSHPDAPQGDFDDTGRALVGEGDNVVRAAKDIAGTARFIRTNERVLDYLTNGVPDGTIAIIDDSGGTLTAPIIEQFAGVVCAGGTVRSHLGILTREYNIPCLMNARIGGIKDGDSIVVESSAEAKTTEDYQQNVKRVGRVWRLRREGETGGQA